MNPTPALFLSVCRFTVGPNSGILAGRSGCRPIHTKDFLCQCVLGTPMGIVVSHSLEIPESEVRLTAVRSRGPGGQHVNKVSTAMVLEFNLQQSATLNHRQKQRLSTFLGSRINQQGIFRLQAQRHRSQSANREEVIEKFVSLLREGIRPPKTRVPTRVPKRIREQRLAEKKQRSQIKGIRKSIRRVDE